MHCAYVTQPLARVSCSSLLLTGAAAAYSQAPDNDFITLGTLRIDSNTTKTSLFEMLRNGYALRNMTPATDVAVPAGYSIYLIWPAAAASDDRSLPAGKPVAEATFTNERLNLFIRFWLDAETATPASFASTLVQAVNSLTGGRDQLCSLKVADPVGSSSIKNTVMRCGKKTLRISELDIEETFQNTPR